MKRLLFMALVFPLFLSGCFNEDKYELKKFYKDPNSPAAIMMGSMYAGVVATFNSRDACMQMKSQAEEDDKAIGYKNSRFVCDKK